MSPIKLGLVEVLVVIATIFGVDYLLRSMQEEEDSKPRTLYIKCIKETEGVKK